jgi:hypothetical protein
VEQFELTNLAIASREMYRRSPIVPRGTIVSAITSVHDGLLSIGGNREWRELRGPRKIVARLKIVPRGTILGVAVKARAARDGVSAITIVPRGTIVSVSTGVGGNLRSIWVGDGPTPVEIGASFTSLRNFLQTRCG